MEIAHINAAVEGERRLISNLIMSSDLLRSCMDMGRPELFTEGVCRIVADWLWEYFLHRNEAPGKAIEDIYLHKAPSMRNEDAAAVQMFLSSLSDDWAPTNVDLVKDQALDFFRLQGAKKLYDELGRALLVRDAGKAESLVAKYLPPTTVHGSTVSLFRGNASIIANAFTEEEDVLFTFPGDAKDVLGSFAREDFIAFGAPPKGCKSWWLCKLGGVAATAGLKVLHISLEMKESQVIRRYWQMFTGTSRHGETAHTCKFETSTPGRYTLVDVERETQAASTNPDDITNTMKRMSMYYRGDLRIRTYPAKSLSIAKLNADLDSMAMYENYRPDVIIVDYADIMAHVSSFKEMRDRINDTYVGLRGMATERHCLVATATQTGRATVGGQKDAEEGDVAEDIRKVAHVTKMIMINRSPTERERGLFRLVCNTTRDEAVSDSQLLCTGCLAIGDPMIDSHKVSYIDYQLEEDENEPARNTSRKRGKFL